MTDPRKIKRLIDWLVKQRAQHLDMVTDAGDASLWCKEEADLIREHIRTVEALATRPKAHEVTPRPAWDDETCLRFAEAYDREDAAQRGEPSPHADKGEGYAEWAAERISCVRAGLALVPAPAVPDDVAVEILTRTAARADAAEAELARLRSEAETTRSALSQAWVREAAAIAQRDAALDACNQARLAFGGYVSQKSAVDKLDAALTQPTGDTA